MRGVVFVIGLVLLLGLPSGRLTLLPSTAAVARGAEEDKLPEENPAKASDAGGTAADNSPAAPPGESWLVWLAHSLGPFYGTIFLAISFCLVALAVTNALALRHEALIPTPLVQAFDVCLIEKKFPEAYDLARSDDSLLGRVLAAGVSRLSAGPEEVLRGMQETGEAEGLRLEARLGYIAMIARLCPLLGLVATVDRLIQAFSRNQMPRPAELGMSLSALLVALWLTVVAVAFYSAVRPRLARLLAEAGSVSEDLIRRVLGTENGTKKK
jgi:biopolymer transport protein ExbB